MEDNKKESGVLYRDGSNSYKGLWGTAALLKETSDLGGPQAFIDKYGPQISDRLLEIKQAKDALENVEKLLVDMVDDHTASDGSES